MSVVDDEKRRTAWLAYTARVRVWAHAPWRDALIPMKQAREEYEAAIRAITKPIGP